MEENGVKDGLEDGMNNDIKDITKNDFEMQPSSGKFK